MDIRSNKDIGDYLMGRAKYADGGQAAAPSPQQNPSPVQSPPFGGAAAMKPPAMLSQGPSPMPQIPQPGFKMPTTPNPGGAQWNYSNGSWGKPAAGM